jgi:hypothetical protein
VATVPQWTGWEARCLRAALRQTVEAFAASLGVSVGTVVKWEKRGSGIVPLPDLQSVLDTALERSSAQEQERFCALQGGAVPPQLRALDSLDALVQVEHLRQRIHDTLETGGMTASGLDDWEQTVRRHGVATRARPAGPLLLDLASDCQELARLLSRPQPVSTARCLTQNMAQMAGLMSLTYIKLGQIVASSNWARTARLAADEAGDTATRSWVWAQEAYTAYYSDDLFGAVEVARHAQDVAVGTACVGVALASALEARAQARLGQVAATHQALAAADAALGRLGADDVVASAFGYNEAQLRFHAGNALTHLGDTAAACPAQELALQLYSTSDYLDRALVHLDHADCLARDGESEAALAELASTVTELSPGQRQGIIAQRVLEVLAPCPPSPAVRALRDVLRPEEGAGR